MRMAVSIAEMVVRVGVDDGTGDAVLGDGVGVLVGVVKYQCVAYYENRARYHHQKCRQIALRECLAQYHKRQKRSYEWRDGVIRTCFGCAEGVLGADVCKHAKSVCHKAEH